MSREFLLSVVGAVLVLEGIPWFLSPGSMKKGVGALLALHNPVLRFFGLMAMLFGLSIVWLGTH